MLKRTVFRVSKDVRPITSQLDIIVPRRRNFIKHSSRPFSGTPVSWKEPLSWSQQFKTGVAAAQERMFGPNEGVPEVRDGESSSVSDDQWQPKSIKDIGPSKEMAEDLEERRRGNCEELKRRELTDEEYSAICAEWKQLVQGAFKDAKICRRVAGDELLAVLKRGYFTEIFETQEGANTYFNPSQLERLGEKQKLQFGYPETKLRESAIHGILTQDRYGGDNNPELNIYGDIAVYFKSDVEQHTTATIGNFAAQVFKDPDGSRYLNARAVPLTNLDERILPLTQLTDNPDSPIGVDIEPWIPPERKDSWPTNLAGLQQMVGVSYTETQTQRIFMKDKRLGVEHIERVVFRNPEGLGQEKTLELINELKKSGISQCDFGESVGDSERLRREVKWIRNALPDRSEI